MITAAVILALAILLQPLAAVAINDALRWWWRRQLPPIAVPDIQPATVEPPRPQLDEILTEGLGLLRAMRAELEERRRGEGWKPPE